MNILIIIIWIARVENRWPGFWVSNSGSCFFTADTLYLLRRSRIPKAPKRNDFGFGRYWHTSFGFGRAVKIVGTRPAGWWGTVATHIGSLWAEWDEVHFSRNAIIEMISEDFRRNILLMPHAQHVIHRRNKRGGGTHSRNLPRQLASAMCPQLRRDKYRGPWIDLLIFFFPCLGFLFVF